MFYEPHGGTHGRPLERMELMPLLGEQVLGSTAVAIKRIVVPSRLGLNSICYSTRPMFKRHAADKTT